MVRRGKIVLVGAFLLGFVVIPYGLLAKAACPNVAQGEKPEDCPWADITRRLEAEAQANHPILPALKAEAPSFYSEIESDVSGARRNWLRLWGYSINFDELAKAIIVHPKVIDSLMAKFNPPSGPSFRVNGRQIVHAGLEHTYGYLFSNLKTSFGYKRARWVRPTLDRGFALPEGTLSPLPRTGTLFSNVTYFAGRIAFRNERPLLANLGKGDQGVARVIRSFDYSRLKITRLEETIETKQGRVIIRTDFVPFLNPVEGEANTHLLVYSIADYRRVPQAGVKLITAFPVEASFVEGALKEESLGKGKPIITRYNAYVPGITGAAWTGTRKKL